MKTDFLRAAAGALLALASFGGLAAAQDIQLASTADMNNISARLAELESRVAASNASYRGGGPIDSGYCDDCCKAGFIAGGEVLWLKAFEGDGDFGGFNFDEAYRCWIGYQRADGLGIRFRYFNFDTEADNGDLFETTHTDLEIYDMVQIGCNWDLLVGAGVRYLDINFADAVGETVPAIAQLPLLQSFTG